MLFLNYHTYAWCAAQCDPAKVNRASGAAWWKENNDPTWEEVLLFNYFFGFSSSSFSFFFLLYLICLIWEECFFVVLWSKGEGCLIIQGLPECANISKEKRGGGRKKWLFKVFYFQGIWFVSRKHWCAISIWIETTLKSCCCAFLL